MLKLLLINIELILLNKKRIIVSITSGYIGIRYLIVDILTKEVATKYDCAVTTSKVTSSIFLLLKTLKILINDINVNNRNNERKKNNEIYKIILEGFSKSEDDKIRFS